MAGVTVGVNCDLYRNAGSYTSPTWTAITSAKNVNLSLDITKADASSRQSPFKMFVPGMCAGPIEFNLLADTGKTEYDVLKTALLASTIIDLAMANGPIAITGNEYWRADYYLFTWKRNEPLDEAATIDIGTDLAYSAHAPGFVTVS